MAINSEIIGLLLILTASLLKKSVFAVIIETAGITGGNPPPVIRRISTGDPYCCLNLTGGLRQWL
jgi:hypothetical protein